MYSAAVLERVKNPRRVGTLAAGEGVVGTGEAGSLASGTTVRIQVRVRDGRIDEARFRVFGCSAAIASAALAAEWLEGSDVAVAGGITGARIAGELDLPDERVHVAEMAAEAARLSVADAVRERGERT